MCILSKWEFIKDDFFKITLYQCLHIFTILLVGSALSFWVHWATNCRNRIYEIYSSLLDELSTKLNSAHHTCKDYVGDPKKSKEGAVLWSLKSLSSHISLIREINQKKSYISTALIITMEDELKSFRLLITGGKFGSTSNAFPADAADNLERVYGSISSCLLNAKISVYD
jgi:hypothetical protein